jgi:hypothetical protein
VDEVPPPPGRVISNDVSEPNRLREIIPAVSVEPFRVDREYLVEMKEVFTGWVSLTGLKGLPGSTIKV